MKIFFLKDYKRLVSQNQRVRNDFFGYRRYQSLAKHSKPFVRKHHQCPDYEGKKIILAGWTALGISGTSTIGLVGFFDGSIDPFNDIDPFDQREVDFNITLVGNCISREYVEKERVFAATNDDDMTMNSYLGSLEVMTQQKKRKMLKKLKTIKLNLM